MNQSTDLYNYGFKHYSSAAKGWMTVDPIKDGLNWYAYVGNNQVNLFDPVGLFTDKSYSPTIGGASEINTPSLQTGDIA